MGRWAMDTLQWRLNKIILLQQRLNWDRGWLQLGAQEEEDKLRAWGGANRGYKYLVGMCRYWNVRRGKRCTYRYSRGGCTSQNWTSQPGSEARKWDS